MNSFRINGISHVGGRSVVISGNKVIIDGKDVTADGKEINIEITGNVAEMSVDYCQRITVSGLYAHPTLSQWQPADLNPTVNRGSEKYFIVAVRRAHSGKVYEFPALYLNEYPLQFEDEYEDRLCTGWYQATPDGDSNTYHELNLPKGDELLGWQSLPNFSLASPKSDVSEPSVPAQPAVYEQQNSPQDK